MIHTLDIKNFLKQSEPDASTNTLCFAYYSYKGISDKTSIKDWLIGIVEDQYPTYTVLRKEIINQLKDKNVKH